MNPLIFQMDSFNLKTCFLTVNQIFSGIAFMLFRKFVFVVPIPKYNKPGFLNLITRDHYFH